MNSNARRYLMKCAGVSALAFALTSPALAQDAAAEADTGFEDIVVTATKKADAENVQDVPFAVTAFGAKQLEDQHVRSLDNLSYSAPNVQLEDVGTAPGYANFSIR
jgi:iron complex outermembrane recepter protein